ncbi:hypothetical protein MHC_02370 [Mycoplasma haemocanis str. Illinois]|uniref:Uncharacterized protein n=1 Tax=Mycoplasma haemocanis (strain Illinois) TaxID=1111676 RepID=H6N6R6_MYCHN|nr:hypothetical protein [Mycoplasma haemocanis]AEW45338.1 hypothetical protein MHC_02370 [Mycoplasma haemocanis str. Illinois]
MPSALVSGITKIILGSSALALGAGGAMSGFIFDGKKRQTLKAVSVKNVEHEVTSANITKESSNKTTTSVEDTQVNTDKEVDRSPELKHPEVPIKPDCKIYKLMYESTGEFTETSKEDLRKETKEKDYQEIQGACKEAKGEAFFVSNKGRSGWKYYPADQKKPNLKNKFSEYLQKHEKR